ncbi:MAG: hypothetical protein CM15mV28_1630 [Thaumasvirus sp.]|nr:MAG: hypothetical protein CM15mV28_1630 [Thaumasvirus sp.]
MTQFLVKYGGYFSIFEFIFFIAIGITLGTRPNIIKEGIRPLFLWHFIIPKVLLVPVCDLPATDAEIAQRARFAVSDADRLGKMLIEL